MSNTVTTIEAEAAPSPRRHAVAEAKRWSALLAKFVSVQIIVQAIGLVTGIFLVRMLSQRQYAYFTIANTMQGTISILADSGISIGLSAIGGKVWHDRYRFGQLINTTMRLRKTLTTAAVLVVTPILIWMLLRSGASVGYAVFVAGAVLMGVSAQLTTGVLEVVPRMHSRVDRLQKLDLLSGISRLLLLGGAYLASLNAAIAVLAASVSLLLKKLVLQQWVTLDVDIAAPASDKDRAVITRIIKAQLPSAVFYCVQGQITVWIISIFGNTKSIAEVGALGRLAVVFVILNAFMGNVVSPAFAKCHSRSRLMCRYWQILGTYAILTTTLFSLTVLFPNQILWVLGGQYRHLQGELVLMVLSSILTGVTNITFALNSSRGWIRYAWAYPSIAIATQVMLLFVVNVTTVKGVILFGLFSTLPNILFNFFMSAYGFLEEVRSGSLS